MTHEEQLEVWKRQLAENATLADFNKYVVPSMKGDEEFKVLAAAEAKRRGYLPDKEHGVYLPPLDWKHTQGRNLADVAWDGSMVWARFYQYKAGSEAYSKPYQCPGITFEEFVHLCRSPYPDKLMAGYQKREKHRQESIPKEIGEKKSLA